MTAKKTDEEVKRLLIADAASPDAWERVAVVPPSTSPRPAWYATSRGAGARAKRQAPVQPSADHASLEAEAVRRKQLHDAIAALPEGQRHAIQLWLDGFQYNDIAHALGVTVDAVKSRLRDAKRHLRPVLDETGNHDTKRNDHRASAKVR